MNSNFFKLIIIVCLLVFITSCKQQKKVDLFKLQLNEKIDSIIDFNDSLLIGVETVEYPFCVLLESDNSTKYNFDGIELKDQRVYFQINSELLKTDSLTRFGGGHVDLAPLKERKDLMTFLKKYKSEDYIYGIRIEMKTLEFKNNILKKIETKYGKGIKNLNTDNGLYWNLKNLDKYIFYAPDYDRLIILNNTNLSKTCYWDTFNGLIDFGGCDNENYTKELLINTTKPENIKNKPFIKVDKNWDINNMTIGKSNESDFKNLDINKGFERKVVIQGSTGEIIRLNYDNDYNNSYFFFNVANKTDENPQKNILKAYTISDFNRVEISFENGLKPFLTREEILKIFNKNQIENYNDLKYSNYIEIKNNTFKVNLYFDENNKFTSIYILKK